MTGALIERLEKAEAGSRDLDCGVGVALGGFVIDGERYGLPRYCRVNETGGLDCPGQNGDDMVPRYTTSLDAIASVEKFRRLTRGYRDPYRVEAAPPSADTPTARPEESK